MALLDLGRVTDTLITLLDRNVERLALQTNPMPIDVTVTPQPPDTVADEMNTLSMYLYHIGEEAYYKNMPGAGFDVPNVSKNPLALSLYYILTAHHDSQGERDLQTQQWLMGLGMKTLHDYPVITDDTHVPVSSDLPQDLVLHGDLRGRDNALQIIMRPVTPEDAINFWSADDRQATRLSSYYEVRVVMLEPEEPLRHPGTVLSVGTFLVQLGAPHLDCTRSRVRFVIPQRNGGVEQTIEATPARVTLAAPNNHLEILGTNLAAGRSQALVLRNELWPEAFRRVEVDADLNPTWNLEFLTDRVVLEVRNQLVVDDGAGGTVTLDVLPGSYVASVQIVQNEQVIQGELKRVTASSNETGFFVTPRFAGPVPAVPAGGTIALAVGGEFDLLNPALPADAIQLIVNGVPYARTAAPPGNGEFRAAALADGNTITLDPLFTTAVSEPEAHAARLIVNGAESPPFWIELVP